MRRKHLYFPNGNHLIKAEKVHLCDLASKFLVIIPLNMNKNNGRSSKHKEKEADKGGPKQTRRIKWDMIFQIKVHEAPH